MSRVGRSPIPLPSGVEVDIQGRRVTVKGPKGTLVRDLPGEITVRRDDGALLVERPDDERHNRALHGLARSLVNNMVVGGTAGFGRRCWARPSARASRCSGRTGTRSPR